MAEQRSNMVLGESRVRGHWVGETLYWDIGDETISDADMRRWVWGHLPEDSIHRYVGTCLYAYHFQAYANRRRAIAEFLRQVNFSELHERQERENQVAA